MFVLIFLGMHIAFAMMFVGFVGLAILSSFEAAMPVTASTMWEMASFYSLYGDSAIHHHGRFCGQLRHDQGTLLLLRKVDPPRAGRAGSGHHRGLRSVRRGVRIVGRHSSRYGHGRSPGDGSVQIRSRGSPPAAWQQAGRSAFSSRPALDS